MSPAVVHVASGREWRGGQRQVWLLAEALKGLGIDQVVVTSRGSELARRLVACDIKVRVPRWRAGLDPRVIWPILQELRRPALLHAHDAHALTLAGVCALLTRTPLVVTRRTSFPLRGRFFWRHACRVITISQAVHDQLIHDGLEPSRLVLVHSAVDPSAFVSVTADVRTHLGLSHTGQLALTLGALTREKDHTTLIRAAARLVQDLPGLHWAIVGDGPLRDRLQREIEDLGLEERVHLLGQLPDPHRALAGADVFVLSSTSEGMGSSLLAAMAREVPIVATRVGGVPEVLGTGAGVLVEPGNPIALASGVKTVLRDPELRRKLIQRGRQELGKFSANGMAEQVLSVYRSCAHSLDGS